MVEPVLWRGLLVPVSADLDEQREAYKLGLGCSRRAWDFALGSDVAIVAGVPASFAGSDPNPSRSVVVPDSADARTCAYTNKWKHVAAGAA